jgi:hypothetical protein
VAVSGDSVTWIAVHQSSGADTLYDIVYKRRFRALAADPADSPGLFFVIEANLHKTRQTVMDGTPAGRFCL